MATSDLNSKYGFCTEQDQIFPAMVVVEITNKCNLACIHCPYVSVSKQNSYKPRDMSWDLYQKIIDEVCQHRDVVFRLLCDGEPLLHPRFMDMIKLAKRKKISPVNFITNGTMLDERMALGVLESGVEVVEISLDALRKGTYESIRRGSNFELVMSNVHRFIELRNEMQAQTKIMVSIVEQPEAQGELEEFRQYWSTRVDKVISRVFTTIGGLVNKEKPAARCKEQRWPCPLLWRRFFINVDGLAEFCVEDWLDQTVTGDVNREKISTIWHSEQYQRLRRLHLSRQFNKVDYCNKCKDWQARTWHYDYFYALNQVLGQKTLANSTYR